MLKNRYRLRQGARIQEVRRYGRSARDRYLVLCALPNGLAYSRCAFVASRRLGRAVRRNCLRRRVREAVRTQWESLPQGLDMVWIIRRSVEEATFVQLSHSVRSLAQALQESGEVSEDQAVGNR